MELAYEYYYWRHQQQFIHEPVISVLCTEIMNYDWLMILQSYFFFLGMHLISWNFFLKNVYVFVCLYVYLFVFPEQTINWWKQPIYEK